MEEWHCFDPKDPTQEYEADPENGSYVFPASEIVSPPSFDRMVNPTKKKIGRNEPCPCGSGKKYKKCCGRL
jgi:uncharacterized protein YecA (UPF0149 family)